MAQKLFRESASYSFAKVRKSAESTMLFLDKFSKTFPFRQTFWILAEKKLSKTENNGGKVLFKYLIRQGVFENFSTPFFGRFGNTLYLCPRIVMMQDILLDSFTITTVSKKSKNFLYWDCTLTGRSFPI